MFYYIEYLYNLIKHYFNSPPTAVDSVTYNMSFDTIVVDHDDDFDKFKKDASLINKVMFALNNMPDKVYSLLFNDNMQVCNKLFVITLKIKNKQIIDLQHNMDDIHLYLEPFGLDKMQIRYILIRVNIIDTTQNVIQHVNCIILDKKRKYMLFFDSKIKFQYDVNAFVLLITDIVNSIYFDYNILFPKDIGYDDYNQLQKYDAFCQTYVFFVFLLIVSNDMVNTNNYSMMFNTTITTKNLGYFLFYINKLLQIHNFEICDQEEIWSFPTNKTKNILNIINLYFGAQVSDNVDVSTLEIKEIDDIMVIDSIQNQE